MTNEEWFAEALSHREDKDWWPVKNASIVFYLPDGKYVIYPGNLDENVNGYMFERVSNDIEVALYEIGAVYVQYTGMMD